MSIGRYERMLARRELRRSRSVAVSVALALLALGAVYVGIEGVLAAVQRPALLVAPADAPRAWSAGEPLVLGVAGGALLLGVALVIAALTPGRRARHRVQDERSVILVDDEVLAAAVSRHVSRATGVAPGQVSTALGRRAAEVTVHPTSGHPLDPVRIEELAEAYVAAIHPVPAVRTRTRVSRRGVVAT
ncbi:MAG: hypothetical protein HY996_01990 [Micrococcales bacterium]|nr:hypothetical protein [Micrococcales bacterium]